MIVVAYEYLEPFYVLIFLLFLFRFYFSSLSAHGSGFSFLSLFFFFLVFLINKCLLFTPLHHDIVCFPGQEDSLKHLPGEIQSTQPITTSTLRRPSLELRQRIGLGKDFIYKDEEMLQSSYVTIFDFSQNAKYSGRPYHQFYKID